MLFHGSMLAQFSAVLQYTAEIDRCLNNNTEKEWCGGIFLPVVPSPANTVSWASLANRRSVFSSGGRLLFRMPSKMVLLTRSGLGEALMSRTLSIHHWTLFVSQAIPGK